MNIPLYDCCGNISRICVYVGSSAGRYVDTQHSYNGIFIILTRDFI